MKTADHFKPHIVAAVLISFLTGCAVGPNYQAPGAASLLPQHFPAQTAGNNVDSKPLTQRWWLAFHDPVLDELVDVALQHSPDLESADANIRQARASLGVTLAQNRPQLNADGRLAHDQLSRNSENFANIPFPHPLTGFNDYRAGFDASWEIDLFGRTVRTVEAAKARLGSVEQQRDDAALRVAAETARNVLDYRFWQLRYENADTIASRNRELLHLARLQLDAGMASTGDVIQAEVNVRNAEADLPPLIAARDAALSALVPLTALPQVALAGKLSKSGVRPQVPDPVAADLSSDLLLRRPDLRIAERQLAAATADIGVAVADQYPRFSLVGDAGWESIQPGTLGANASRYWNLGPQLSLPLLSGGRLDAQIKSAEAGRDAALASYRKSVLMALSDVETALIRCQAERERSHKLQMARASQDQQLNLANQRFLLGETPQTDLIAADLQVAGLNDQQLASEQALAGDMVALFKALGGGL